MWDRAQRSPFNHVIPKAEQDKKLSKKLAASVVQSAILAWCVQGCLDWQKDGLPDCAAVDASVQAYKAENDRCLGFIADYLEFADPYRCNAGKLREAYEAWCRDNGIKHPMTGPELAKRLEDKGGEQAKSGSKRYWRGFRLAYQGDPQNPDRDTRDTRDTTPRDFCTRVADETLSGSDVPHVPHVPNDDSLDDAEYQAEFAWRGEQ